MLHPGFSCWEQLDSGVSLWEGISESQVWLPFECVSVRVCVNVGLTLDWKDLAAFQEGETG